MCLIGIKDGRSARLKAELSPKLEFGFFKGPFNARVVFDSGLQSCYCGQAIYSP